MVTTTVRVVIIPSISPGDVVLTYRRDADEEHVSVTKRCLVGAVNNASSRPGRDNLFFVRSDSGNSGVYLDARALIRGSLSNFTPRRQWPNRLAGRFAPLPKLNQAPTPCVAGCHIANYTGCSVSLCLHLNPLLWSRRNISFGTCNSASPKNYNVGLFVSHCGIRTLLVLDTGGKAVALWFKRSSRRCLADSMV